MEGRLSRERSVKLPGLADLFELSEDYLSPPDETGLRSVLVEAVDRQTEESVVLKYWQKTKQPIDGDLRELWRHDMRQSERIRAYPSADEVTVQILRSGEVRDAFYFALPADAAPLDHVLRFSRVDHWIRTLNMVRSRILFWKNVRRLVKAVGAIHAQGLVHGRIDRASVFTGGATAEPDFRLSGFEFCLRVADPDPGPISAIAKSKGGGARTIFSFLDDWRALSALLCSLLGLATLEEDVPDDWCRPTEIDLLRLLERPDRNRALDAHRIIPLIDEVLDELEAEALVDNGRFVLALRLGPQSRLSAYLFRESNGAFDVDDIEGQFRYVRAQLEVGVDLVRTSRGKLVLATDTFVLELGPLTSVGQPETWQVAVTNSALPRAEYYLGRHSAARILAHRIELIRYGAAGNRLRELRGDALPWDTFLGPIEAEGDLGVQVRRGLLLAQIADAMFQASEITPVDVRQHRHTAGEIDLVARESDKHTKIMQALRADTPRRFMTRLFDNEEADFDAEWDLSESSGLGTTGQGARCTFVGVRAGDDGTSFYSFRIVEGALPPSAQLYLRRVASTGTEQALRRRLRMLTALSSQSELTQALAEPRAGLRTYDGPALDKDAAFDDLDESKRDALQSVWTTGPLQFVVGPPGVGKTKLVTEIVRRVLAADNTTRLLVSSQAHEALDHLAEAVQQALEEAHLAEDLILVRSKADKGAELAGAQTPERAKAYIDRISNSELLKKAPQNIRRAVRDLRLATEVVARAKSPADLVALRQRRPFEALVLQSANVLFSTVNSPDLERLNDEHAVFDWVIIEEAAKATGPELVAPLLLSMRRVLIGDHNQLPPFDTDRISELLADKSRVRDALEESDQLIGYIFRDYGLDDLRDVALQDDTALGEMCQSALRSLLFFESHAKREIERQDFADVRRKRVANELLVQHRMHPAICRVISTCFYDDKLNTDESKKLAFEAGPPPFLSQDPAMPNSPIVFVDLPYIQRSPGAGEEFPTYHNSAEVEATVAALGAFRSREGGQKRPSLAVLSPYNEQVTRLRLAIDNEIGGRLRHLQEFRSASLGSDQFQSTVDSFQGNEADLVLVSMVRNNENVGRRALGILADRRRMNVLLSRARWKLVIVGSLEFLKVQSRRYDKATRLSRAPTHLKKMLDTWDQLSRETMTDGRTPLFCVVPAARLARSA